MGERDTISVIGLGYVGLPLAVEFGRLGPTIGFDINEDRIQELKIGKDSTLEVDDTELAEAKLLRYTTDLNDLSEASVHIITVPTPIDDAKIPNLNPLLSASKTVGSVLKKGDTVIYESTVYPGVTEEECVPVLEKISGLKFNQDFTVGYSPERINPGDKEHRLPSILKVTSGSTDEAAEYIDQLYKTIITAGTHKAPSIKIAEAAKVIENTQRDVNIALVNELALIFERLGIDTADVLEAAGTKWNFLPFRPGLVGGHCIGVDPYYLTHKAQILGYHPEVVLAGRRINDHMGGYIANRLIREMILKDISIKGEKILVLGLTFKENCPDLRNTKVIDVIHELLSLGAEVDVCDPWADPEEADALYNITLKDRNSGSYHAVVMAVPHKEFYDDFKNGRPKYVADEHVFFDIKSIVPKDITDLDVTRL